MTRATLAAITLWLMPLAASAQTRDGSAQPQNQGPMIVERVHSGFLVAPDFKVTEVDKTTSELVGGYAGWLSDETFFVGGGGYWLANEASDRKMAYGGLVLQWMMLNHHRVGLSAKGLIGGGEATLGATIPRMVMTPNITNGPMNVTRPGPDDRDVRGTLINVPVRYRQNFFVAEPEVDAVIRLTHNLRLTAGVGYRTTSAEGRDDNRLRGAVGSIGLQIGGGGS